MNVDPNAILRKWLGIQIIFVFSQSVILILSRFRKSAMDGIVKCNMLEIRNISNVTNK